MDDVRGSFKTLGSDMVGHYIKWIHHAFTHTIFCTINFLNTRKILMVKINYTRNELRKGSENLLAIAQNMFCRIPSRTITKPF